MPAFTSLKQPVHTKPSMSPCSEATARALQRIFCAANNLAGIGSQHKKSNLRSLCWPACQPNRLATRLSRRPELKQSRLLIICIRYMDISCVASWLSQSASEGQLCETDETKTETSRPPCSEAAAGALQRIFCTAIGSQDKKLTVAMQPCSDNPKSHDGSILAESDRLGRTPFT